MTNDIAGEEAGDPKQGIRSRGSEAEQEHVVDVLMKWIGRQMKG